MKVISTAPGKVILAGEHAVVYGQPAIVAAVQMRTRVTIERGTLEEGELVKRARRIVLEQAGEPKLDEVKIKVETTLPIGSGLGSSASLAAGIVGGLAEYMRLRWDKEKINAVTYEIEKGTHGNPSGIDNTAVVYGGLLRFERGTGGRENIMQRLKVRKILQRIWLVDSGKPEETTGEMVAYVKEQYEGNSQFGEYFEKIGKISNELQKEIETDHFSPDWIRDNERLLEKIGVVSEKAKVMIKAIEEIGGVAKICGAGGRKNGSGVILAYHPDDEKFESWLISTGQGYFQDHLGGPGWRREK
ncbi:MAG: hypothetical protein ACD_40C00169G0006 [uncultured bacterium]|nr:MAG: hypothetical protein ACD_40C00169G0006 [uncultured bacterium]